MKTMFINKFLENKIESLKAAEKNSNDFWPYLCLLRITATRPISQQNVFTGNGNFRRSFYVKWVSPLALFSVTVSVFSLYLLTMMILNGIFEVYWPQKLFDFENQMTRPIDHNTSASEVKGLYKMSNFIVPILRLTVTVHHMVNIKATVNQLNAISGLADDLQTYCAARCSNLSSKIRRNSIRTMVLLVGIPLVVFSPIIVYSFSNDIVLAPMIMREVVVVLVPFQLVAIYFDDAEFIIQCDIASEFYRQIEMVLVDKKEYLNRNCCSVRLVEVRKWHQFLLRNRKIVGQIGTTTKIPQLLSLMEVTTNLTVFVYTICKLVTSTNSPVVENVLANTVTIYVVVCLIRLYVKTRKAEYVTASEVRVHDALFALNEFPQDLDVQLELQGMRNTISATPARIAFGNYVVLDKGVLVAIFAQVVTYLIVLLQFDSARS